MGGNSVVAVAIDNDKGSYHPIKWAIENLLTRGQTVILIHVVHKPSPSASPAYYGSIRDMKHLDKQFQDLFLCIHCFCTRKNIKCLVVRLEDTDVAKAISEYVSYAAIEYLVLGASSRHGFIRRFKINDIPTTVTKSIPDFCAVYVISKGKISSAKISLRPSPITSPLQVQGSVHTGGSINFSETWHRMKKKHGDKADAAAVFIATHTAEAPDGSGPKWINPYYQGLYEEYEKRAREEAIEEGSMDPESTERPAFREKLWKAIVLEDKQPKGDHLPGFGPHGAGFFNMPLSSHTTQCFSSSGSRNVDQETFDARVQKEVKRQVEIERQEREVSYRQLESKFEERLREELEVMQRQFEERMQQVMTNINLQQQQPTSGNTSASSVGQYLYLDGGRGTSRAGSDMKH